VLLTLAQGRLRTPPLVTSSMIPWNPSGVPASPHTVWPEICTVIGVPSLRRQASSSPSSCLSVWAISRSAAWESRKTPPAGTTASTSPSEAYRAS